MASAARAVLIVVGLSPFWVPLAQCVPGLGLFASAFDAWFGFQCHREPVRSLSVAGTLLSVCARCLGIYTGVALGALVMRPRLSPPWLRVTVGFALVVMLLDVVTEWLDMRPESSVVRLLTGLLLAWPISVQLVLALRPADGSAPFGQSQRP